MWGELVKETAGPPTPLLFTTSVLFFNIKKEQQMDHIDILYRTFRTLTFNLSLKLEENPDDNYLRGMLEGIRMADSLVSAWEMETNNLTDLLESKPSLPDGKVKN